MSRLRGTCSVLLIGETATCILSRIFTCSHAGGHALVVHLSRLRGTCSVLLMGETATCILSRIFPNVIAEATTVAQVILIIIAEATTVAQVILNVIAALANWRFAATQ